MHKIIVQLKIDESIGLSDNLALRHRIEDILDGALRRQNEGDCDGGDIGSGTMNIWLYVKTWKRSTEIILEHLRHHQLLHKCTVAQWRDSDEFKVVWPSPYIGKFQLMYLNESGA